MRARTTKRRSAVLALLLCLCAMAATAAERPLRFRHLEVEDGLSNGWVRAIIKDSRGFLWFGTSAGLNRFDGTEVRVFRHDPDDPRSLPGSHVTSLLEDGQGRFWIGLAGKATGLALYDRRTGRFEHAPLEQEPLSRFPNEVGRLLEDRAGRIWVTANSGFYRFDPETMSFTRAWGGEPGASAEVRNHVVYSAVEDLHGQLWLACGTGLVRLDPETGAHTRWSTVLDGLAIPSPAGVTDVYADERGFVWFLSDGVGLVRLDPGTMHVRRYGPGTGSPGLLPVERPRRLLGDRRGTLYVGSEDAGLSALDVSAGRFTHYAPDPDDPDSLSAASIWALHVDDEGILWVGSFNGGVDSAPPSRRRFELLTARPGQLTSPSVASVLEDHAGSLWIGTDGGGLHRVDRSGGGVTVYRHDPRKREGLASDSVLALLEDRDRRIWIGTWQGGLQVLDPRSGRFQSYRHLAGDPGSLGNDNVFALALGSAGELLVGTQHGGVQVLDRATGRFNPLSARFPGAGRRTPNAIVEDQLGNLWIGVSDGAEYVDRETGSVTHYPLEAGDVFAVHPDRAGNVWFGTRSGGLVCLEGSTRRLRRFTESEGLPSNRVTGILEASDGDLWLATARGLVRFEDATRFPEPPRFTSYDSRDGLQGDEFRQGASAVTASGEMLFGGPQGLVRFDPGDFGAGRPPPRAALTGLRILGQPATFGDQRVGIDAMVSEAGRLELAPDQTMVTFQFAALEFVAPGKSLYRHRLEGFDTAWSPPGPKRTATYTNLAPGEYRLQVAVGREGGAWNEDALSLVVVRTPRLDERPWFRAFLIVLVAALAAGLHRLRVARHLRTEWLLQERFETAMAEVKSLSGLLPLCAWCRRVRTDEGYWSRIETFIEERSDTEFAESTCPSCAARSEAGGATGASP